MIRSRRQYLYHPDWQASRERQKYDRVVDFARALPRARRIWQADLADRGLTERRVLAAATGMLDAGYFRIGSPSYAEKHGTIGLITLQRKHVRRNGSGWQFRFVGKSGVRRIEHIDDPTLNRVIAALMRRRGTPAE